jgi:phospholipase C
MARKWKLHLIFHPGKQLANSWNVTAGYDLSVHGPNGFFRRFKGSAGGSQAGLVIQASYGSHHDQNKIVLTLQNPCSAPAKATVSDRYSSRSTALTIAPGGTKALQLPLGRTRGWYDLSVTLASDGAFEYRYAGHVENGEASISDPGMGGLI